MPDSFSKKLYTSTTNGVTMLQILPGTNTPYGYQEFSGGVYDVAALALDQLDRYYRQAKENLSRLGYDTSDMSKLDPNDTYVKQYLGNYNYYGGDAAKNALTKLVQGSQTPGYQPTQEDKNYINKLFPDLGDDGYKILSGQTVPSGYVKGPSTADNQLGIYTEKAYNELYGGADVEGSVAWHEEQVKAGKEVKVPIGNGFGYVPAGSAGEKNLVNMGTNNTSTAANNSSKAQELEKYGIVLFNYDGKLGIAVKNGYGFTSGIYGGVGSISQAAEYGIDPATLPGIKDVEAMGINTSASKGVPAGATASSMLGTLLTNAQSSEQAKKESDAQSAAAAAYNANTPGAHTAEQQNAPGTQAGVGGSGGSPGSGSISTTPIYVKTANSNDVYDVSTGTPRYISYDEAVKNNIWGQIKTVDSIETTAQQYTPKNPTTGGGTNNGSGGGTTVLNAASTSTTPLDFQNTAAYKALNQEQKDLVDLSFGLVTVGGEAEASIFANALKQAQSIADPYYKAQFGLILGEMTLQIAKLNNDYDGQRRAVETMKKNLIEDISLSKESLDLSQQTEFAQIVKDLDADMMLIADAAAEKGVTFGEGYKSRQYAEQTRETQAQDVIQSTTRTNNLRRKELEMKAARGDAAATEELRKLEQDKTTSLQSIGLKAEELLGTAGVAQTPLAETYKPVGGVTGSIEEEKSKAIIKDTGAFVDLQKAFI